MGDFGPAYRAKRPLVRDGLFFLSFRAAASQKIYIRNPRPGLGPLESLVTNSNSQLTAVVLIALFF